MTCLVPFIFTQYYRIKYFIVIYLINKVRDYVNFMEIHSFTTLTENSRATPVYNIQIVVRFFVDHRIKQHTSLLVSETV